MKKGQVMPAELRAHLSAIAKGRYMSPETRAKISATLKGRLKGPIHSPEQRAKWSAMRKGKIWRPAGWHHTEEQKQRLSQLAQGRVVSDDTRARIGSAHKGRKCTSEQRATMSAAQRGHLVSQTTRQKLSKALKTSPAHKAACSSSAWRAKARERRSRQSRKHTTPERTVQSWLRDGNIKYITHYCLSGIKHEFDIAIPNRKLLIEVDGCYWHGCPEHFPNSPYRGRATTRAANFKRIAARRGWRLVRIWEHDTKDAATIASVLDRFLSGSASHGKH